MNSLELPPVRGRLLHHEVLAPYTWFRVGGPAEVLFLPADEADLREFLKALPRSVPVLTLGVGSNVIIRDGGLRGVVVRLPAKPFGQIEALAEASQVRAGAAALDAMVAKYAAQSGIAGLEFLVGIPGSIGGALTMNAGCYGAEIKDVLVCARAMDRDGVIKEFSADAFRFSYRRNDLREPMIFLDALFQGRTEPSDVIQARMSDIMQKREAAQPIREKTGGSTFKNPPGQSAWSLVDQAGMRGARRGGAQVSEKHANFLINTGAATAADIEGLGEDVRAAVLAQCGVTLDWEIKRLGESSCGNCDST